MCNKCSNFKLCFCEIYFVLNFTLESLLDNMFQANLIRLVNVFFTCLHASGTRELKRFQALLYFCLRELEGNHSRVLPLVSPETFWKLKKKFFIRSCTQKDDPWNIRVFYMYISGQSNRQIQILRAQWVQSKNLHESFFC